MTTLIARAWVNGVPGLRRADNQALGRRLDTLVADDLQLVHP